VGNEAPELKDGAPVRVPSGETDKDIEDEGGVGFVVSHPERIMRVQDGARGFTLVIWERDG
jgi:hypothetical protein